MKNLFFRRTIAPYRIDTYNFLYQHFNFEFFFYWNQDKEHRFSQKSLEEKCDFKPFYLKGIGLGKPSRFVAWEMYKIVKKSNPDIVIAPEFQIVTIQLILIRIFFQKKFKIISMCDDSFDMLKRENKVMSLHSLGRRLLMPFIDELILLDFDSCNWYRRKYSKGVWIPIIRNEISERRLINRLIPLSKSLFKKHLLTNKKVLLYVGRLVAVKNLNSLLISISKLERDDFVLIIIGSGPEEQNLLDLTFRLKIDKKVKFLGRIEGEELNAWYNISSLFVLPSIHEPFGAVVNEALLAGVYCLVSNAAGSRCLIYEGENGETFNPLDTQNLANIIDGCLSRVNLSTFEIELKPNLMKVSFNDIMSKFNDLFKNT